jgi:hypothetical protein
MRKLLSILFAMISFVSFGQNVRVIQGYNPTTMQPGVIYRDTSISLPYTANKYITGFATVGSQPDSVRGYFAGTTNRIAYNSTTGVFDIANLYVGQTSLTTLGTIGTGVWNGTAIGAAYGGTGQTTVTTGDLIYGSASNTWSKLAAGTNGYVLTMASGIPVWSASTGGSGWGLSGNAATAGSSVLGTTNNVSLRMISNGIERMNLDSNGYMNLANIANAATFENGQIRTPWNGISFRRRSTPTTISFSLQSDSTNNEFLINGNGSGLRYKEGATSEFSVSTAGAGVFNSSLTSTTINATSNSGVNANFYNANGSGVVQLSNNVQVGGSGYIYSTQGAGGSNFGLKFTSWNGSAYLDRWYIYQSNGSWSNSATYEPTAILNLVSTTAGIIIPRMTTAQRNAVASGITLASSSGTIVGGAGYTNGSFTGQSLTGGHGSGAIATIFVSGGIVTNVNITTSGINYLTSDVLSASLAGGSGFTFTITSIIGVAGTQIYNTTTNTNNTYNGTYWTQDLVASGASTLVLLNGIDYVFTGSTATWTLPTISATILGRQNAIKIKNRGSGTITLNTASGSTLYTTAAVSTINIIAGAACELMPDGTYHLVMSNN